MPLEEPEHWGGQGGNTTEMLIRIYGKENREFYGDIVHCHLEKPVPYRGAAELVLKIDAISRSLNPGVAENQFRSVHRSARGTGNTLPKEYWKGEAAAIPARVTDTIYLQLVGRQHTSIQGRICGRFTGRKYISFRSALELIYLLTEEPLARSPDTS